MQIRTDLAMESSAVFDGLRGVKTTTQDENGIEKICVVIETDEAAEAIGKQKGHYVTLCHSAVLHFSAEERKNLADAVAKAVSPMLPKNGDLLVIGLGNRRVTADALGNRVIENLLVTRHMKSVTDDSLQGRLRGVCAAAPGVLGVTGMETAEMVKGIVEHVKPAAVIAIDALAARETGRICSTIQVTDTGIQPGSGVSNHRLGLTRETLGVPVIAIGVPMVVYASVIARDALTLLMQDTGMETEGHSQALESLVKSVERDGLGELVVTPREVDELVGRLARILADGLNMAMQPRLTNEEIQWLSHEG